MNKSDIVIAGAARTAMGGFQGVFKDVTASELGGNAIAAAVARAGLAADQIDEVLMGCVLPAGQGQAPARQAAIRGGLPHSVPATTVNKMCGSGMRTVMAARDLIATGGAGIVVAGGMESMSRAPYILPKAREGMRLGHGQVLDHMFLDGLEDAYEKGRLMSTFAEDTAQAYQFTRQAQDAYAAESLARAKRATVAVPDLSTSQPTTLPTNQSTSQLTNRPPNQPLRVNPINKIKKTGLHQP
jgi:acetyl-CoA C-acetyltransferase